MRSSIEHRPGCGLLTATMHGRSGIAHALLGSAAAWMLRAASCNVAVERPEGITFEAP